MTAAYQVLIYARARKREELAGQVAACCQCAALDNAGASDVYTDIGSGRVLGDGLVRMLADLQTEDVVGIIMVSHSRISRDPHIYGLVKDYLDAKGVSIITVPSNIMLRQTS